MGAAEETAGAGDRSDPSSPSLLALFRVVAHKKLVLLVRYPVNTATRFATLVILFGLILFGGEAVAGAAITDSLEGIIVGFFIWTMAIVAYQGLAWNITREAQWGTLERLFISPHGIGTVMLVKLVVNVLFSFLWAFATLLAMMALAREWLVVDPATVLPLLVLTVASISGLGLVFAGLALLYKRIENIFQLLQFAFVGLIAAPVGEVPALAVLPVSHGSYLLREAMRDGTRLWEFAPGELGLLIATSAGYFLAGFAAFQIAQRRAREQGLLGQY